MGDRSRSRREFAKIAEPLGFSFEGVTRKGHFVWRHREGFRLVTGSALLGAPRALKNAERDMHAALNGNARASRHADRLMPSVRPRNR